MAQERTPTKCPTQPMSWKLEKLKNLPVTSDAEAEYARMFGSLGSRVALQTRSVKTIKRFYNKKKQVLTHWINFITPDGVFKETNHNGYQQKLFQEGLFCGVRENVANNDDDNFVVEGKYSFEKVISHEIPEVGRFYSFQRGDIAQRR